jgi:mRNA interferase MazF
MGIFTKGDVVVAPLDFSDFSNFKRRPALVIATPRGLDPVLCMITSRKRGDAYDVVTMKADFESGGLRDDSVVRACHIFSMDEGIIEYQAGKLKDEKVKEVITKIVMLLNS